MLFLGGGGSAADSLLLDREFVRHVDPTKPLVYVPHAKPSDEHPANLEWFKSVFRPLGIESVILWPPR